MSQTPSMTMAGGLSGPRRQNHGGRGRAVTSHALLLVVLVGLVVLGHGSSAWADGCANAALRAQNNSSTLPDCRAYEMVSPPYKEGFNLDSRTFSDDGAVSFISIGSFGTGGIGGTGAPVNQYVSTRSAIGWTTVSPNLPTAVYRSNVGDGADALSADLRWALWRGTGQRGAPVDAAENYYLTGPGGSITRVGPTAVPATAQTAYIQGASADLSHIVFAHGGTGSGAPNVAALYEFVGTGHTGPARPVSVDNNGQQTPGEACPAGMSVDGRVIFFGSGCHGGVTQVWARVGGTATIAVSRSECTRPTEDPAGPCNGVSATQYVGSAVDGSRVFFTTDQQLVNADTDTTGDLYACDIPDGAPAPIGDANPCSKLREISGVTSSGRVQSVPAVSQDGSRVYFIAQGVLADNLGTNNAPAVDGHDNLYLWSTDAAHPDGQITFVTDLAGGGAANARMTPDGRYLVFATTAPLIKDGPGADTDCTGPLPSDCAADLYRYDAQTGALVRVSTGVSGSGGNTPAMDVSIEKRGTMTADGSTIVFATSEALSPQDIDNGPDVYAWHDGRVSLISDGQSGGRRAWITPSGRDIFFMTAGPLTALDGDVNEDIYDARVDGGLDLTQPPPCFGDNCQAAPSPTPDLPTLSGGGSGGHPSTSTIPTFSLEKVSTTQRRRLAQTGKLTLAIKTNTLGVVTVSGNVTGLPGAVTTVRKTVTTASTVRLTAALSKKARARLATRGRLSLRLVVSHSKVALSRSITLALTHTKTKK